MNDAAKINQTLTLKVTPPGCLIFLIYTNPILLLSVTLPKVYIRHTFSSPALGPDRFKSQVPIITPPPPFICAASTIHLPPCSFPETHTLHLSPFFHIILLHLLIPLPFNKGTLLSFEDIHTSFFTTKK